MSNPNKRTVPILIGTYQIDASLTEQHQFDSEVTEFPVEQGGDITDNVRPKPITVMIEGIVSDTPLGTIADLRNSQGDNGQLDFLPSADALAALLAIRDAREPISISTTLQSYDNMVMTTLAVPRDATTGAALRFSATFQQVIFVTNNRTTIRVATPSVAAKVDLGRLVPTNLKTVNGQPILDKGLGHYVDQNGNPISQDQFNKAATDQGAVLVKYNNGVATPVNPADAASGAPSAMWWNGF